MTITDIAKELNLSIATVSKALNDSGDISEEKRKMICEYAHRVGYRSRKQSAINGRLAILWGRSPRAGEPLSEVADSFRRAAENARYVVESDVMDEDFDLNDYLTGNRFHGAFLLDINFRSPVYAQLGNTKHPLVLVDNYISHPLISGVGSDNIHALEEAVDFLVGQGHRRIAFLGGELQSLVGAERLAGYILGLAKNCIEYRYDLTYFGDYTFQAGVDAATYFLEYEKEFTAVICASDIMASGFMERMRKAGRRIPEDISVLGYDDVRSNALSGLMLSTIRQDFELTGEIGFRALEGLRKGLPSQRSMVGYTLIPRGTTKKCEQE